MTYEVSLDHFIYVRRVKSILDILRDIGGLSTAIGAIFSVLVTALQYRGQIVYVMSEIFATPLQRADILRNAKKLTTTKGSKTVKDLTRSTVQWSCI